MATLHVRNVPEKLYAHIQALAEKENRSITAEVIQLLEQGIKAREIRKNGEEIMDRIRRRAKAVNLPPDWLDSVALVREDRER